MHKQKYHNDAMICAQQFLDSSENPTENIDYDPNIQTRSIQQKYSDSHAYYRCRSYLCKARDCP